MKPVAPAMLIAAVALSAVVAFAPKEMKMALVEAPHLDVASPAYALSLPTIR
ncbi:MAG: hypothetical protein AAGI51_04865 [Pseudomonadota bacterium]